MGYHGSAVLAYGYDLGDTFAQRHTDTARPACLSNRDRNHAHRDDAYSLHAYAAALRTLFAAVGGGRPPDDYLDDTEVFERCGVTLAVHGSVDESNPRVILSAKTFHTMIDSPEPVDVDLPHEADQRLTWALDVLGIKPTQPRPQWILAASVG